MILSIVWYMNFLLKHGNNYLIQLLLNILNYRIISAKEIKLFISHNAKEMHIMLTPENSMML